MRFPVGSRRPRGTRRSGYCPRVAGCYLVDPQTESTLDRTGHLDLDENLLRQERQAAVHAGLDELRPEHRDLLILLFADPEFSYQEISRKLGIPTGSIGPTRARSLRKLHATTAIRALAS